MRIRLIALLISLGILAVLIYYSDFNQMIITISQANVFFILLGLLTSFLLMFLRAFRWQALLKKLDIILPFKKIFYIFMGGYYISNITPAKSGDVFRNYLLKREGLSFSKSLPSTFIERIFDFIILITLSIIGLLFVSVPAIEAIITIVLVAYIVLIILGIYISLSEKRILFFFDKLYKTFKWFPKSHSIKNKITRMALDYNKSFIKYNKPCMIIGVLLLSLIVWILESMIVWFSFYAIGLPVNIFIVMFILLVSVLIGVASSLPGGLGSQEAVMVLLFTFIYTLPLPLATAAILISRFLGIWMNIIVGALILGTKCKV